MSPTKKFLAAKYPHRFLALHSFVCICRRPHSLSISSCPIWSTMVSTRFSRGAVASVLASLPFTQAYLYDQVVSTAYGDVQGYQALDDSVASYLPNWESVTVFKGIPFAATTGGANRFRAPQPASPWNGTLDAADFGNICPVSTSSGRDGYTVDEDCLSLNIWTPANSTTEKLPVVMWSYPAESTALDALFDGGKFAGSGNDMKATR